MAINFATRSTTRLIRRGGGLAGVRSVQDLIDAVAARRGKPIVLTEAPLPPEVSGFCARGRDCDYVVIDKTASELTRLHATLHELFHLWEEHPTNDQAHQSIPEEVVRQLLPNLKAGAVLQLLTRSHYDHAHERRAEAFATVMLGRIQLRDSGNSTGFLTSAFAHRRSGV